MFCMILSRQLWFAEMTFVDVFISRRNNGHLQQRLQRSGCYGITASGKVAISHSVQRVMCFFTPFMFTLASVEVRRAMPTLRRQTPLLAKVSSANGEYQAIKSRAMGWPDDVCLSVLMCRSDTAPRHIFTCKPFGVNR